MHLEKNMKGLKMEEKTEEEWEREIVEEKVGLFPLGEKVCTNCHLLISLQAP